jgi:hypothetical protein
MAHQYHRALSQEGVFNHSIRDLSKPAFHDDLSLAYDWFHKQARVSPIANLLVSMELSARRPVEIPLV